MSNAPIIAYCHIGKVGGKRLQFYLRSHFGYSYRCVSRPVGGALLYSQEELESDLKWNPYLKYVGGHAVRPYVDYGSVGQRLQWFSFFRAPIPRMISHYYQQTVLTDYNSKSLVDWLATFSNRAYWQIKMIAGEKNLGKAKDTILNKYSFVGLNEHYEESLLLLGHHYGLKNFRFADGRSFSKPEEDSRLDAIFEELEKRRDDIEQIMSQEIEFYEFVTQVYQKQREAYGSDKLSQDLEDHFSKTRPPRRYGVNNLTANGLNYLLWRPRTRFLSCRVKANSGMQSPSKYQPNSAQQ